MPGRAAKASFSTRPSTSRWCRITAGPGDGDGGATIRGRPSSLRGTNGCRNGTIPPFDGVRPKNGETVVQGGRERERALVCGNKRTARTISVLLYAIVIDCHSLFLDRTIAGIVRAQLPKNTRQSTSGAGRFFFTIADTCSAQRPSSANSVGTVFTADTRCAGLFFCLFSLKVCQQKN